MKIILFSEDDWKRFINSDRQYDKYERGPTSYPCLCIEIFAQNPQGSDYRHEFVALEEIEYGGAARFIIKPEEYGW